MGRAPIKSLPSQERLRELLSYDETSGVLTWRARQGHMLAGSTAGTVGAKGHRMVRVDCTYYLAHRLIWKLMTGSDPTQQVDHINGERDDNRWLNLREASHGENVINSRPRRNRTGHRGVSYCSLHKKFRAVVTFNKKTHHVGYFDTAELASVERQAAAERIQGEFVRAA